MGRKHKQEKIYQIRDEIEALDIKKGRLDWYDAYDQEERYRLNRYIKHKQAVIKRLFDQIETANTSELIAKVRQRLKNVI